MDENNEQGVVRAYLRTWGRRRRTLEADRDPLVARALKAGISIEEIHMSTGLARTTIDRIGKETSDHRSARNSWRVTG
jgi:DNA-binding transcriptional regulator YdaS (Cro superfamily)